MDARLETRVPATFRRTLLISAALLVLAACQRGDDSANSQQMAWAKDALERNPNLEIVATDAAAGVFTVRDRRTQEIQAVKLDEIAAAPIAQLGSAALAGESENAPADADAASDVEAAAAEDEAAGEAAAQSADDTTAVASGSPTETKDYTIERAGGRVRVSGPGVSIVSGDTAPVYTAKGEPGQRTVDPIICEGQRMMHFDGRDIYVDGDAITVRGGCELYITNSRIVASSTGVVVREGTVHIANSYVEGATASFDAANDSRLYLRGSTFQGVSRRNALAMIEDQGGNRGLPAL
jgi:hypothetical protein